MLANSVILSLLIIYCTFAATVPLGPYVLNYCVTASSQSASDNSAISQVLGDAVSNYHPELSADSDSLILAIESAESYDDVLELCERIPAIERSMDKAMRIAVADLDDAILCTLAVQRLSSLFLLHSNDPRSQHVWKGLERDRRFEQLTECVELLATELPLGDLSKYVRSLISLHAEQDSVQLYAEEFARRSSAATPDEIGGILWALAAAKDTFGWMNQTLSNELMGLLNHRPEFIKTINPHMLVRTLWALSSLDSNHITSGFELDSLRSLFCDGVKFDSSIVEMIIVLNLNSSFDVLTSENFEFFMEKILISVQTEAVMPAMLGTLGETLGNAVDKMYRCSISRNDVKETSRAKALMNSCIEAVIEKACKQLKNLSVYSLTTILRLAVRIKSASTTHLLNLSQKYFDNLFSRNESVSAQEAVALLEVLASAAIIERNSHDSVIKGLFYSPDWHRVVGRLAVACAGSTDQLSRHSLIDAIWAVAVFNQPYRHLLRAVRKSVQFCLHQLSPATLCKLAVAVAIEETSGSQGFIFGERSAKLDRDFVDQVVLSSLAAINDMPTLDDQIDGIIAVAQMGRISGMGSVDDKKSAGGPLRIDSYVLKQLNSNRLVKLNWAFGRLPAYVPSRELLEALRDEISERFTVEEDNPNFLADCMVYISSLASTLSGSMDASLLPRAGEACSALLRSWKTHGKSFDISLDGRDESEKGHTILFRAACTLSEALQSFIELRWYDANALQYCESWLKHQRDLTLTSSSTEISKLKCHEEFFIGKIEELISIYKPLVENELQNPKVSFRKRIFSKFLHGFFHSG